MTRKTNTAAEEKAKSAKPVQTFTALAPTKRIFEVSVWQKQKKNTGEIYHVASAPSYSFKGEDRWVRVSNLEADEILTGVELLKQALDFIKKLDVQALSVG